MNGSEEEAASKPSKQPRYTKLTQQELDACKPVLDATWAVFIFASITFIMIPVGAVCLVYGMKPVEYVQRYDVLCPEQKGVFGREAAEQWLLSNQPERGVDNRNLSCQLEIKITQDMKRPVYIYYELDGVYQNHRRYVKSRSDVQLKGETIRDPAKELVACEPQLYFEVSPAGTGSRTSGPAAAGQGGGQQVLAHQEGWGLRQGPASGLCVAPGGRCRTGVCWVCRRELQLQSCVDKLQGAVSASFSLLHLRPPW